LFGVALSNGVYYYYYEIFKLSILGHLHTSSVTVQGLVAGTLAGAATAVITNPVWVVNTRLATEKKIGESKRSMNTVEYAMQLYKKEGLAVFFRGMIPALILVANPAIQYMVSMYT
jgi:adenine nucleotide transporter 17